MRSRARFPTRDRVSRLRLAVLASAIAVAALWPGATAGAADPPANLAPAGRVSRLPAALATPWWAELLPSPVTPPSTSPAASDEPPAPATSTPPVDVPGWGNRWSDPLAGSWGNRWTGNGW